MVLSVASTCENVKLSIIRDSINQLAHDVDYVHLIILDPHFMGSYGVCNPMHLGFGHLSKHICIFVCVCVCMCICVCVCL